jgi:RimJ/RimL family protein N-acetyltransferase
MSIGGKLGVAIARNMKEVESRMRAIVVLRAVEPGDLPLFFEYQLDPDGSYMAAFTAADPSDRAAFDAHWAEILHNETGLVRTILADGQVAGSMVTYEDGTGQVEVGYWLGKSFWGRGIATAALRVLLLEVSNRPLYARVAKDNLASLRVLRKCGFTVVGEDRGFANARGQEIEEWMLRLD